MIVETLNGWAFTFYGTEVLRFEWPITVADLFSYLAAGLLIWVWGRNLIRLIVRFVSFVWLAFRMGIKAGRVNQMLADWATHYGTAADMLESKRVMIASVGQSITKGIGRTSVVVFLICTGLVLGDVFEILFLGIASGVAIGTALRMGEDFRAYSIITTDGGSTLEFIRKINRIIEELKQSVANRPFNKREMDRLDKRMIAFREAVDRFNKAKDAAQW